MRTGESSGAGEMQTQGSVAGGNTHSGARLRGLPLGRHMTVAGLVRVKRVVQTIAPWRKNQAFPKGPTLTFEGP